MSLTLRGDKKGGEPPANKEFAEKKPADQRVLDFTGDAGQVPIPMALDTFLTLGEWAAFLRPWYTSDRRRAATARLWMTLTWSTDLPTIAAVSRRLKSSRKRNVTTCR